VKTIPTKTLKTPKNPTTKKSKKTPPKKTQLILNPTLKTKKTKKTPPKKKAQRLNLLKAVETPDPEEKTLLVQKSHLETVKREEENLQREKAQKVEAEVDEEEIVILVLLMEDAVVALDREDAGSLRMHLKVFVMLIFGG